MVAQKIEHGEACTWNSLVTTSILQVVVGPGDSIERLQHVLVENTIWVLVGVVGEHGWNQDMRGCCDETGEGTIFCVQASAATSVCS